MITLHSDQTRTVRVGDTQIVAAGGVLSKLLDPYHLVLTLTWPQFFGVLVLIFTLVNLIFGTAY